MLKMKYNLIYERLVFMNRFEPLRKRIIRDKVVISMRIEEDTLKKIDELAREADISRNEFINQCIDYALGNIDIKSDAKKKKVESSIA